MSEENSQQTGHRCAKAYLPDRFYMAFLDELNSRFEDGTEMSVELLEMIERHIKWARTAGAESVINKLQRTLELTPHYDGKINYAFIMELIRTTEPGIVCLDNTPRKYNLRIGADDTISTQKRTLKP